MLIVIKCFMTTLKTILFLKKMKMKYGYAGNAVTYTKGNQLLIIVQIVTTKRHISSYCAKNTRFGGDIIIALNVLIIL